MTDYKAPLDDYHFLLGQAGYAKALDDAMQIGLDADDYMQILDEAGKLASDMIGPANRDGDLQGAQLENGIVRLPDSFMKAFEAYQAGGWAGLSFPETYGGQDLPWSIGTIIQEFFQSANMAWGLNSLLTIGATETIMHHGSDAQKQLYLPKLISGEWSGTMNLTEPQAGSDLAKIRSKATPHHDDKYGDHYRLSGQKIYITYGDHEASSNIVHLVLARIDGAPAGVKGISLFIVPKFIPDERGELGARNDVKPLSLEKKMGIHGSPTCVMAFGEDEGAVGYLVGKEHQGLPLMFTMMNLARLMVGVQGLAISDRAYQQALEFAKERKQGQHEGQKDVTIIHHEDVRRMLYDMRAKILAMRALLLEVMLAFDRSLRLKDGAEKDKATARQALMVPVVKGWFTDNAQEITSLAVQIHGGAGFVEDSGVAQHYRDARILPIYEGTNGIQAMDLVGRKIMKDEGKTIKAYQEDLNLCLKRLATQNQPQLNILHTTLSKSASALQQALSQLEAFVKKGQIGHVRAMAHDLNQILSLTAGGAALANALMNGIENGADANDALMQERLNMAAYYAQSQLVLTPALAEKINHAPDGIMNIPLSTYSP